MKGTVMISTILKKKKKLKKMINNLKNPKLTPKSNKKKKMIQIYKKKIHKIQK